MPASSPDSCLESAPVCHGRCHGQNQAIDVELLPNRRSGGGSRFNQDLIENCASWCVRRGVTIGWTGRAADNHWSEIETVVLYEKDSWCSHGLQEPPAIECGHARSVNDMG